MARVPAWAKGSKIVESAEAHNGQITSELRK